ncbi:MAG: DUF3488 and transglutaminase-like domain-containing protein, partial [Syntrophales bacterium]|nr:DUF3488 and transglutaminase-like domain-containing protein [Syntrophales bacterium]
ETNIITPGLETLCVLLPLKLLERKEPRDYLQIYFLAILLLAGSSLLSLDMVFLAYLAIFILLLGAAAILVSCLAEKRSLTLGMAAITDIGRQVLLMTLIVIPVSGLLFFVLPRTSYPFFDFLNRGAVSKSGFSDSVRLGNVSQIQMDEAVVMRVEMERIDERLLYWRGIVFDYFDGHAWKVRDRRVGGYHQPGKGTRHLRYTVYLEPSEFDTILTLDHPAYVMMRQIRRFDDLTWSAISPLTKKTSYEAISIPSPVIEGRVDDPERYLNTPSDMVQIRKLTGELTANQDRLQAAQSILRYLKNGRYTYALKNLPLSDQPLEDFLFRHRYGNCEYFASAMAIMLRFRDIPSRLVGGYRGGYYQDLGRYYVVPQKFAHVWVEAYIPEQGWVRFDPTPYTAADFSSWARLGVMFRIRMAFDILEYYWNMTIINYDLQKQVTLFTKISSLVKPGTVRLTKTHYIWIGVLISCLIFSWFIRLHASFFVRKSREKRVLGAFLRRMTRLGYRKRDHEGLEEFVGSLPEGPEKKEALNFVERFQGLYYRDQALSRGNEKDLREIIRNI